MGEGCFSHIVTHSNSPPPPPPQISIKYSGYQHIISASLFPPNSPFHFTILHSPYYHTNTPISLTEKCLDQLMVTRRQRGPMKRIKRGNSLSLSPARSSTDTTCVGHTLQHHEEVTEV